MQGIFAIRNTKTGKEYIFYTRNHNKYWEIVKEKVEQPETASDFDYIKDMRRFDRGSFVLDTLERIDGSEATVSTALLQERKNYWIAKRNPAYNFPKEKQKAKISTIDSLESRITLLEEQVQTLLKTIQG
jgi:predicted Zn-dependent protease